MSDMSSNCDEPPSSSSVLPLQAQVMSLSPSGPIPSNGPSNAGNQMFAAATAAKNFLALLTAATGLAVPVPAQADAEVQEEEQEVEEAENDEDGLPRAEQVNLPEPLNIDVNMGEDHQEAREGQLASNRSRNGQDARSSSDSAELPELSGSGSRSPDSSSGSSSSSSDSDGDSSDASYGPQGSPKPSTSSTPKTTHKKSKKPKPEPTPSFSFRQLTLQANAAAAVDTATPPPAPAPKPKKKKTTPKTPKTPKTPNKAALSQESAPPRTTNRKRTSASLAEWAVQYDGSSDDSDDIYDDDDDQDGGAWSTNNSGLTWKHTPHKPKSERVSRVPQKKKETPVVRRVSESPVASTSTPASAPSTSSRSVRAYAAKRAAPLPSPSVSVRSLSSPRPKNAKKEKHVMYCDRNTYTENSRMWFTQACVRSKAKELAKNGKVPQEVFDMIMEKTKEIEEQDCCSKLISLDTQMPSSEDYRGLTTLTKQEIYSSYVPIPDDAPSSTFDLQQINFTGKNYMHIHKTNGASIITRVQKQGRSCVAELLNREKSLLLVKPKYGTKALIKQEAEKIVCSPGELSKFRKGTLPVFTLQVHTKEEFENAQKIIEDCSICLIEGTIEACGFDPSRFSPDVLKTLQQDYDMTGPRQLPQSMQHNFPRLGGQAKNSQYASNAWSCPDLQHDIKFPEFVGYFKAVNETSENAVLQIVRNPEEYDNILKELAVELTKLNIPLPEKDKGLKGALTIAFGSNIDIEQRTFADGKTKIFQIQHDNVRKFPEFILPDFNYSLLDYCGTYMAGINTPQVYMKVPGVRTAAHLENGCLASINLNLGPGSSYWVTVPLEFAGKFQELTLKKLGLSDLPHERFFDYGFWPNEKECLDAGIPLQKFEQKPGVMVYVGVGTYHWVQANEFTTQVSWNVAPPNSRQLAWLAISNDHYLAHHHPPLIPLDTLCWGIAATEAFPDEEAPDMDKTMRRILKQMLMRSLANCQTQVMFVKEEKLRTTMIGKKEEDAGVQCSERCKECKNWTFNIFLKEKRPPRVVDNKWEEVAVLCLGCAKKLNKLHDSDFNVYQRHDINQLIEWYDKYSLEAPPPRPAGVKKRPFVLDDEEMVEEEVVGHMEEDQIQIQDEVREDSDTDEMAEDENDNDDTDSTSSAEH